MLLELKNILGSLFAKWAASEETTSAFRLVIWRYVAALSHIRVGRVGSWRRCATHRWVLILIRIRIPVSAHVHVTWLWLPHAHILLLYGRLLTWEWLAMRLRTLDLLSVRRLPVLRRCNAWRIFLLTLDLIAIFSILPHLILLELSIEVIVAPSTIRDIRISLQHLQCLLHR